MFSLFYTDDLVECNSNLKAWKVSMESKRLIPGLLALALMSSRNPGSTPVLSAAVCRQQLHRVLAVQVVGPQTCRGITERLVADPSYVCSRCHSLARPIDDRTVVVDRTMLDVEATFCYLGNTLGSGDGCDSAIAARYCMAWRKFRRLLLVLTTRHPSHKVCGKVYNTCVRSAMLHDGETWGPNAFELEWIRSNDRVICWISGTKDRDEIPSPDSKVHGANMEPIWGRQDPGEPYVGPKNLAI